MLVLLFYLVLEFVSVVVIGIDDCYRYCVFIVVIVFSVV